jgi:D-alanyl-D-alanine carboxypeptidase
MKTIVLTVVMSIFFGLIVYIYLNTRPISQEKVKEKIESLLKKQIKNKKTVSSALVYIDAPEHNFEAYFAAGVENNKKVSIDQPFHVASVGKAFTSTLIGLLIDEDKIQLSDKIIRYLDPSLLEGLFVYNQADYKDQVSVGMLLNHTSSINDYFEEPGVDGQKILDKVIGAPDHFFKPEALIDFTRHHQKPVGKPGQKFHYSDTGYILLGLIIEKVSGMKVHEMLKQKIFEPLNMMDSYMLFYSQPLNVKRPIADLWLEGHEVSSYSSLSVDWTGGGIISTVKDLSIFVKALNKGTIITKDTLDRLYKFDYVYRRGIHYGYGFMSFRFAEFFPTLKNLPNLKGHMGILGSQMLYDEESETCYISSFGSSDYPAISVRTMIQILSQVKRIQV